MSLSRWTARTRGASFCRESGRRGRERAESEREGKKSPQTAAWHRCKDSISGGFEALAARKTDAPPWNHPCTASRSRPSPSSTALARRPVALSARALRSVDDGRAARRTAQALVRRCRTRSRASRSPASHWRGRGTVRVPHATQPAAAGAPGGRQRPRPRTGQTSARRSGALRRLAARATRGGSEPPTASRHARSGHVSRVRAQPRLEPGDVRIPLRVPAATVAPAIVPRARVGGGRVDSAAAPPRYAPDMRVRDRAPHGR